jgi:integral membrane protein (TIGR01906 family)
MEWLLVLTLPVLLIGVNLRVVTGHWLVRWEYQRPGFPADPFGLSTSERIRLATVCQDYLASNADISLLASLELPGGARAFNERELRHMADVQNVFFDLTLAGGISGLLWLSVGAASLTSGWMKERYAHAIVNGSLLTLGLLAAVGGFMAVSWGEFFTAFHRLFFTGDTWLFPNSDTLIRLFPIRFWIDVALVLVGLTVIEATALGALGWARGRSRTMSPPSSD